MKSKKIKKIFNTYFKYPNPIFCIPYFYFQHKNFICEIARTKSIRDCKWNNFPYKVTNPLLIFEGLFIDDGVFITVLERTKSNEYIRRIDLDSHLDNPKKELNSFINRLS